jgi:hypothetical protein
MAQLDDCARIALVPRFGGCDCIPCRVSGTRFRKQEPYTEAVRER